MGSNHLGHFLLTLALLPALRRGAAATPGFGARVVHVSSSMHMLAAAGIRKADPHFRCGWVWGGRGGRALCVLMAPGFRKLITISGCVDQRDPLTFGGGKPEFPDLVLCHASSLPGCSCIPCIPPPRLPRSYGSEQAYAQSKLAQVR